MSRPAWALVGEVGDRDQNLRPSLVVAITKLVCVEPEDRSKESVGISVHETTIVCVEPEDRSKESSISQRAG